MSKPAAAESKLSRGLRTLYKTFGEVLQTSYVISMDGSGDPIIIDQAGKVSICYHDTGEIKLLADSLEELIEEQVVLIDEISGGNMGAFKDGVYVEPLELEKLMLAGE